MPNWGQQLTAPKGYEGEPIWSDLFLGDALDTSKWNKGICSRGSKGSLWNTRGLPAGGSANGLPGQNNAEWFWPGRVAVDNGLTISAVPSKQVGYLYESGCICTYGHFALRSGIFRVRARMPDVSKGAWPAPIWCLPGPTGAHGDNGEGDGHEGGMLYRLPGVVPPNQVVASTYHRPDMNGYQLGFGYNAGVDLSKSFHDYDLELSVGMIRTLFDDVPVGTWTKYLLGDPLQLIIGLSVAAASTASWHTTGVPTQPCLLEVAACGAWGTAA